MLNCFNKCSIFHIKIFNKVFAGASGSWLKPVCFSSNILYSADSTTKLKKKLIILGTGWGSYSVLKNVNKKLFDITVVSPRNHFLFTPLLCSTTVGTLEFRSIIEPVRNACQNSQFHLSSATILDLQSKTLTCKSELPPHQTYKLQYDQLVIGVGALSNTFNIPGVAENAYFLKELWDARNIRNKIIDNFELATQPFSTAEDQDRLLHIVIVGGGPTGIEFGAELYDFLREDVSRLYPGLQTQIRVTLIEANKILGSFDKSLREYAEKKLSKRKQFILLQAKVAKVEEDKVVLTDGREIPCGLIVWSTGLSPRSFTKNLQFPKDRYNHILTDEKLQVKGAPANTVFALGDCACIENLPLPSTAQAAERQGIWLAKYLSVKTDKKFQYSSLGMLAYVGGYRGLSDFKPKFFKLKGFHSWLVWRSAYLTRLGSWKLRLQVPVDWSKTFIFGRDTSRF